VALINCPECSKEISDKSEKCVHCGYPIRTTSYIFEEINGNIVDVSFFIRPFYFTSKTNKTIG
jgi:hypothetical protein